jgi:multiple sugar transport system substrate-binding protein
MAKKLRRFTRLAIVAPLLTAALVVTGCASQSPAASTASPTAAPSADGPITVWVGSWWASQIPAITKAWNQLHPKSPLTIDQLPVNGAEDKLTSAILGGAPPDVADVSGGWISSLAQANLLQPLNSYIKEPEKDFNAAAWQMSLYKGSQFAIPDRAESNVFFYNKTVFDRAKVAYPTASWTYADLKKIAKEITIPGVQSGFGMAADQSDPVNVTAAFVPVLWADGGNILNKDNTKATINSAAGIKAITYWSSFYTTDHSAPAGTPNYTTTRDLMPLFENNQLGLLTQVSSAETTFAATPGLQWGAVPAPAGGINQGSSYNLAVPAGATNAAGGREFIKWFVQPANLAKYMNRMPARTSSTDMAPWTDPVWDVFKKVAPETRSLPSVVGWAQMQTAIITELQKVLVKQETPTQAAAAMSTQINAILARS